jgi:hypothetical protein
VHTQAALLFAQPGLEDTLRFEQRHQAIIERFGRYTHRNAILGRQSTPEELAFLSEPGSGFRAIPLGWAARIDRFKLRPMRPSQALSQDCDAVCQAAARHRVAN